MSQYLFGIAVEDEDGDGVVKGSFSRKSLKVDYKLMKPGVEATGSVQEQNIQIIPREEEEEKATGTISRTKSGIVFETDCAKIKLW